VSMVHNVADLVSLARRARSRIRLCRLSTADSTASTVDVLWRQRAGSKPSPHLVFTASEMGFQELIDHWIDRRKDLIDSLNLIQSLWEEGWFVESAVLALATTVESLGSTRELPSKLEGAPYQQM